MLIFWLRGLKDNFVDISLVGELFFIVFIVV